MSNKPEICLLLSVLFDNGVSKDYIMSAEEKFDAKELVELVDYFNNDVVKFNDITGRRQCINLKKASSFSIENLVYKGRVS